MLTIRRGFTLIEVIIAFTIAVIGLAFVYGSFGIITGNILRRLNYEDMLYYNTAAFAYEKIQEDFVIKEHIDMRINGETISCEVLENRTSGLILTVCPYLTEDGVYYTNIVRVRVKEKWFLIPK